MTQKLLTSAMAPAAIVLGASVLLAQGSVQPAAAAPQIWESCEEMHDSYVRRFESSRGFGLTRMWQPPMLDRSGLLDLGRTRYSIDSIELIGLLNHETPVAYVPLLVGEKPHPMNATRRDLTDFEKGAVASFRASPDLASGSGDEPGTLQCVGALRAKEACLSCHKEKKAGDLLGAFTFRLRSATRVD